MSAPDAWELLDTPLGLPVEIHASPNGLEAVFFRWDLGTGGSQQPNDLTRQTAAQLREYFAGRRQAFDVPLACADAISPYRRKVWNALVKIPYGQTRTYAQIAAKVGGSPRSVGTANGRNPICILRPCHRVVRNDGLGGYGGPLAPSRSAQMLEIKRRLLELEGCYA